MGSPSGRAGTILISIFGYETALELMCDDRQGEAIVKMLEAELEIVEEYGFGTMPAALDCNEMSGEERAVALPGMITWQQLKEAAKEPDGP